MQINFPNLKINNIPIEQVKEFSFLGIVINEHVNWNSHITHISKKISKSIGIMNRIKFYVPRSCLKNIYLSLIHSHLNYGILLWGFKLNKLRILQKKAVRILSHSHYLAHCEPLFKNANIMKIDDIFKMHCFKLYYNFINKVLPTNIENLFRIDPNEAHKLQNFDCHDACGRERIRFKLPQMINAAPLDIIQKVNTHTINAFKINLKKYLIQTYDDSPCTRQDCYACDRANH